MNYFNSPACAERLHELETEYIQARHMINRGCLLALDDQLRQALSRVSQEVQNALNDGAVVMEDDLAILS